MLAQKACEIEDHVVWMEEAPYDISLAILVDQLLLNISFYLSKKKKIIIIVKEKWRIFVVQVRADYGGRENYHAPISLCSLNCMNRIRKCESLYSAFCTSFLVSQ